MNRLTLSAAALFLCTTSQIAQSENWRPLTGANILHEFVSGATAELQLTDGVTAIGYYRADGTAEIRAWNETFRRTWQVQGDDQVCYTSDENRTNCFTFEQDLDSPGDYRSRNVETGQVALFRILDATANQLDRTTPPDDDGGLGSPSVTEIAAALSDPNTTLGSMNFQFDYVQYEGDIPGADNAEAMRMTFQPSLPYSLNDTTNLFVRPAVPVIFSQDVPDPRGGFESEGVELGDIGFDALLGKSLAGGVVVLGGVTGTLPTATDDALGRDQWLLGPAAAAAIVRPWGVLGVLATHQWDVAGEDDFDTSITSGQYFYAFNLGKGRQINGSPLFSYNHEASSDNKWSFPLAIGYSQTVLIKGRPWKFGIQYWHYIESPDLFGPDYQIRLSVSPVVKLPW